jgi:hypothetical protein
MDAILDASTLDVEVLQDWYDVGGEVPTRQKLVTILVGELWPGQDLRAPVRFVVPAGRKAKGILLTGGNQTKRMQQDTRARGVEAELLKGGVGLVQTVVQTLKSQGQAGLDRAMHERFIKTLDPHVSIQYWGWPATLMRAVTAAYAETGHFERGRVAVTGGSKNGASPSVALIHDVRLTAQYGTVSPLWESPLRLCDRKAWDELEAFNGQDGTKKPHAFLGGTYGPIYNHDALAAGHDWKDLQNLANKMAPQIFLSKNLEALRKRGVEMLFEPGTHDFVCFDVAWGGTHYPKIPVYYRPNSGHGKKAPHPGAMGARNRDAFLLRHFFPEQVDPLLPSPVVETRRVDDKLHITVQFPAGAKAESGRLFWMYDRAPDGSAAYLRERLPDENWKAMDSSAGGEMWEASISLEPGQGHIDFFSCHGKTIRFGGRSCFSAISSPYTRFEL